MSWASKAGPGIRKKVANALNVNAEVVSSMMYGLLERNKVGRGNTYDTKFFTLGKGAGRKVIPYGKRKAHTASAPGDPPARDSGGLMESISVLKQATPDDLTADTGPSPDSNAFDDYYYAAVVEYGTRDKRVLPRPFIRPTADAVRKLWRSQGIKVVGGIGGTTDG